MTQKKAPVAPGAKAKKNVQAFNSQRRDYRPAGKKCKVELYPEGSRLSAPSAGFLNLPNHLKGIERGEIKGWSVASRKRMREWLLTHQPKPDHDAFSVTMTVPGPPLEREEWEKLWNTFGVYLRRMGGGAVWRKEIQSRESVHWHCLVVLPYRRSERRTLEDIIVVTPPKDPDGKPLDRIPSYRASDWRDIYKSLHQPRNRFEGEEQTAQGESLIESGLWQSQVDLYRLWFRCLDTLGPCVHTGANGMTQQVESRSHLYGADRHAVEILHMPELNTGWNRYMLDHTTKAKQEQIAEHHGRQWGVINKKAFDEIEPEESVTLTWREYSRFLRVYNRLITPYVKDPDAMFGKVRGRSFRRGMYGKYVTFSNPGTLKRMIEWAKAPPEG
jgi:hypothetical protein